MTKLLEPNFKDEDVNLYVAWYLMCSYLYYQRPFNPPLMRDEDFDKVCEVLLYNYDTLTHPHSYLLDKDSLRAGTGFTLREEDYPLIVKHAVVSLYKEFYK